MSKETVKQIIGALLGLTAGILFLTIGFFRTVLLIVLVSLGWWLSGKREIPQGLIDFISRIRLPWN